MIVLPDFSPTSEAKLPVKNGGRAMRPNDAPPIDAASIDGRFAAQFMQHFTQQARPDPDMNLDVKVVQDTVDGIEAESDTRASDDLLPENAAAQHLLALLNPAAGLQLKAGLNDTATLDETDDVNAVDSTASLPMGNVQTRTNTRTNRLDAGELALEHTVQSPAPDARHTPNPASAAQTETTPQAALPSALNGTAALTGLPSSAEASQPLAPNQTLLPAALSTTFISSGTTPIPAPTTQPVATPFNQADWGRAVMQQVVQTLANGKHIQHVELRLNPPDLGALQVTLRIENTHAQAWFASPHAHVREAVHSALPELAQQLQQAGLALSDAQVGSEQRRFAASEQAFAQSNNPSQSQDSSQNSPKNPSQNSTPTVPSGPVSVQTHATGARSLLRVDTYA